MALIKRRLLNPWRVNDMDRVLVIDDDKPIAELLKEALTKMGYRVQTAPGGREGLRLFEKEIFDLVITDVIMPDIDGRSVAKRIRDSDRPWIPVMGISGTPWLLEGEFDSVLPKPFGLKALALAVTNLLSASSVTREASQG
jgi:two-component system response regulator VanR